MEGVGVEGLERLPVSTPERILRGGGVVEALAVAGAVSEHPCEGVTRGAKMLCFLFLCLTSPPLLFNFIALHF